MLRVELSGRPKGRQWAPNASKTSSKNHQKLSSGAGTRPGSAQGTPKPPQITIFHKNPMEKIALLPWIYIIKKALIRSCPWCLERLQERSVHFSCWIHANYVKHL